MLSKEYTKTIKQSLGALGKEHFFIILPSLSFPSPSDRDTGVGTAYSDCGKDFISFLSKIGINGIQFMPSGLIPSGDPSPYSSSLFSDNYLFIDLFKLTSADYASILSKDIFYDIVKGNPNIAKDRIAYNYAHLKYIEALREAYKSFNLLCSTSSTGSFFLESELRLFLDSNEDWLYKDSLFYALSLKYGSDDWSSWDYIDRVLCLSLGSNSTRSYISLRRREIEGEFSCEIGFYNFVQFLCYKQKSEFKSFALGLDFSIIGDLQISLSARDIWANQDIFLEDYCLGVPPDYFSETGQAWGFPVLDPGLLFNNNANLLGRGGLFLRSKFLKIFSDSSGLRIDHIIGLIDPWVYRCNARSDASLGGGRLFSSPDLPHLKDYSYISLSSLNTDSSCGLADEDRVVSLSDLELKSYASILENILFPSASQSGISSDFILICEDLGTLTYPVRRVMEEYSLSGIRVTQFVDPSDSEHIYRGKNVETGDWIVAGTHDNDSLIGWFNTLSSEDKDGHISMLIEDLLFYEPEEVKESLFLGLHKDVSFFVILKLAELFASDSKHIEIMFTDLFGISKRYNKPSTVSEENWTLRLLPSDLSKDGAIFHNLPYILYLAFRARGDEFVSRHRAIVDKLLSLF